MLSSLNVVPFLDSMSLYFFIVSGSIYPLTVGLQWLDNISVFLNLLPSRLELSIYLVNEVQVSRFRVSTICPDMRRALHIFRTRSYQYFPCLPLRGTLNYVALRTTLCRKEWHVTYYAFAFHVLVMVLFRHGFYEPRFGCASQTTSKHYSRCFSPLLM